MVLLQSEVQKTVAEQTVTKVNGPPTSNDLDLLEGGLIVIAASILLVLGEGMNGHAGMLLSNIELCHHGTRNFVCGSHQSRRLSGWSHCSNAVMNGGQAEGTSQAVSHLCWCWDGTKRLNSQGNLQELIVRNKTEMHGFLEHDGSADVDSPPQLLGSGRFCQHHNSHGGVQCTVEC